MVHKIMYIEGNNWYLDENTCDCFIIITIIVNRDSSVGTATPYGPYGPGIDPSGRAV